MKEKTFRECPFYVYNLLYKKWMNIFRNYMKNMMKYTALQKKICKSIIYIKLIYEIFKEQKTYE